MGSNNGSMLPAYYVSSVEWTRSANEGYLYIRLVIVMGVSCDSRQRSRSSSCVRMSPRELFHQQKSLEPRELRKKNKKEPIH